jgi:thiol-disulfide isomerase/thioredoxin
MNKKTIFALLLVSLIFLYPLQGGAKLLSPLDITEQIVFTVGKYYFRVGGQPLSMDVAPQWIEAKKSFLIPLRQFAELLRYQVDWNDQLQLASITKDNNKLSISLKNGQVYIDKQAKTEIYFEIRNSRILLDDAIISSFFQTPSELIQENSDISFTAKRLDIFMKAPDFALKDVNGLDFELYKAFEDPNLKLVAINFYSTFCPFCLSEIPNLLAFNKEYKNQGVMLVGIDTSTSDPQGRRVEVINRYGIDYPILIDRESKIYDLYRVSGIPNIFLIDRNHEIVLHHLGIDDAYFTTLYSFMDAYLGQ